MSAVSTGDAFAWFDAAHETGVPGDSAFFTLVCADQHPPDVVYAALLEDARVHRVRALDAGPAPAAVRRRRVRVPRHRRGALGRRAV